MYEPHQDAVPPAEIWLQWHADEVTWERDQINNDDVRYVREDVPLAALVRTWADAYRQLEATGVPDSLLPAALADCGTATAALLAYAKDHCVRTPTEGGTAE